MTHAATTGADDRRGWIVDGEWTALTLGSGTSVNLVTANGAVEKLVLGGDLTYAGTNSAGSIVLQSIGAQDNLPGFAEPSKRDAGVCASPTRA